jgi:hypothetical protein
MRFVRENLFYVILVAVVVVGAVGAVLFYTSSGIDENVKSRKDVSKELLRLSRDNLKVDANAVEIKQKRIEALKKANESDLEQCIAFNRKSLPVLKIPVGAASEVDAAPFDAKRYQESVPALYIPYINKVNQTLEELLAQPALAATSPPTSDQITDKAEALTDKFRNQNAAEVLEKATRSMVLEQADAGMIYAGKAVLDRVLPEGTTFASPDKLWEAQVNVWVTGEILRAIAAVNQDWLAQQRQVSGVEVPASVPNSAVRHLLEIAVTETIATPVGSAASGRESVTKRKTGAQHGVVPYWFTVVMPTRHVRRLIDRLQSQNYHTVTNLSLAKVQLTGKELLYYGTEPVMRVRISGELLLLGDWVRDIVPEKMASLFGGRSAKPAG